jgi:hypothetical protein
MLKSAIDFFIRGMRLTLQKYLARGCYLARILANDSQLLSPAIRRGGSAICTLNIFNEEYWEGSSRSFQSDWLAEKAEISANA